MSISVTSPDPLIFDLRFDPPPAPMLRILNHIDSGDVAAPLIVLVPHYPSLLIPELEARHWACTVLDEQYDHCRVYIAPSGWLPPC